MQIVFLQIKAILELVFLLLIVRQYFFVDNNSEYICCIHSGWKGAYKNIIMKAVACYKRKNIAAINIMAVVGPCIGFNSVKYQKF